MTRLNKLIALATVALVGLGSITESQALTATTTFGVSAVVSSGCAVTALPLAFGAYDGTVNNASTTVTVLCTLGTAYNVGLNAGGGTGASVATRKLTSGANTLDYTLYTDSGRTTVWGNTVGTNTVSGTYALAQAPLTVYGRITASQSVPAGTYNDTIPL